MNKKPAIFLDRDGVINKKAPNGQYVTHWGEFEFLPGIAKTISNLNEKFLVVVVSNQRGVARGMMPKEAVEEIHTNMAAELKRQNARVDAVYVCYHDNQDNCDCRKPKPGMLLRAAKDLDIDLADSYMVGDQASDIEAGKSAGCKTVFLGEELTSGEAADFIIKNQKEIPDIFKKV